MYSRKTTPAVDYSIKIMCYSYTRKIEPYNNMYACAQSNVLHVMYLVGRVHTLIPIATLRNVRSTASFTGLGNFNSDAKAVQF